jgi:hypothetical protein
VHRRICSGTITLEEGGRELTVNWVASYRARFGEAPWFFGLNDAPGAHRPRLLSRGCGRMV